MKTYLNTETGLLTLAAGATTGIRRIDAKRGDLFLLEVVPSGTITGATGVLAAKATYAGEPVALDAAWTAPATEGAGYLFSLDLNTTELNALFTGETPEVSLLSEITWSLSGAVRSSQTFSLVVARDVWRGDEADPTAASDFKATQAEAEAGTDNTKWMTPLRVAQAIAEQGGGGGGGGGGSSSFTLKFASFNAEASKSYAVDTSGGAVTATLPATPAEGDVIEFADAASTWNDFNLILAPNGEKVFGRTSNFSLKTAAILATVVYVDGERGWAVFSGMSVPVLVTAPAISGTETEFQTLTATPGTWTNAPTEYRYQWQLSANGTSGWADIEGATSATYALQAGDTYVRVTVIATNSAGDSDAEPSASSGEIAVLPVPANTALPTLSGTEAKGSTLTATSGTWENGTPTYGYQWQRSANGTTGWADITGATAATHVLVEDDVDAYVRAEVIATNAKGASDPAYSAASGAIAEFSLLTGLVAHWKLNEESGTRADSHGSYDLTDNNSVGYAAGKIGNAATLTTSQSLGSGGHIDLSAGFTACCWLQTSASSNTSIGPAVAQWKAGTGGFMLGFFGAQTLAFVPTDGSPYSPGILNGPEAIANTWYFLVGMYDPAGLVKFYVNNVLVDYRSALEFTPGAEAQLQIGSLENSFEFHFDGMVDSVTIFGRNLSEAEIAQLYNSGSGLDYEAF